MRRDRSLEQALANFQEGYNCAQSVFLAHDYIFDFPPTKAARLMSGFGGGVGKSGGLCGVLTAVISLIGLVHGREKAEDMESQAVTYEKVQNAMADFESKFGSIHCRTLIGDDILAPGVKEMARDEICPKLIEYGCQLVATYGTCSATDCKASSVGKEGEEI